MLSAHTFASLPGMAAALPCRRFPLIEEDILLPALMKGFSRMKVRFTLG